jgi:amphi-Trp domain-containing protein
MASQHLKVKSTSNLLEIVNHLEHLVSSLKEGTIYIRKADKVIAMSPCEPISFELEVEVKQDKDTLREELSIELKWKKKEVAASDEEAFVISHQEPVETIVIPYKDQSQNETY